MILGAILMIRRTPPGVHRVSNPSKSLSFFIWKLKWFEFYRPPYPLDRPKNRAKKWRQNQYCRIFSTSNFCINFRYVFFRICLDFEMILVSIWFPFWHHFLYFLHRFFGHRLCMSFKSTFYGFLWKRPTWDSTQRIQQSSQTSTASDVYRKLIHCISLTVTQRQQSGIYHIWIQKC